MKCKKCGNNLNSKDITVDIINYGKPDESIDLIIECKLDGFRAYTFIKTTDLTTDEE